MPGEGLLGTDRGGVIDEDLVQRHPLGRQRGGEAGQHHEQHGRGHPHAPRRPVDQSGDTAPHTVALARGVGRPGHGGPVGGAAQQDQDRRQEGQRTQHRADDPDRTDRPERPIVRQVARQQGQQPQRHGRRAGGDRPRRPAHGGQRSVRPVAPYGEFLAEARRDEQGVVGRGTDHEDRQDPLDLAVHADGAPVGQRVHHRAGQPQGEHRTDDDHQRQQHAAVDQQQDQQHRSESHAHQQPVDPRERVRQVRLGGCRAGDPHRGARHPLRRLPHLVQDRRKFLAQVGRQRDDGLDGQPVGGDDRRRGRAGDPGPARETPDGPRRGLLLPGRHPGPVRRPHHDRRNGLCPLERLAGFEHLRRLGAARQERRLVVRRDLAQLPRVRSERPADAEPYEQQGERNDPAGPARCVSQCDSSGLDRCVGRC